MPSSPETGFVPLALAAATTQPVVYALPATAGEGDGHATVVLQLSQPATQPFTISYLTNAATARADTALADYVAQSADLVFAPGETSKTVTIALVDDAIAEPSEVFWLVFFPPDLAGQWFVPVTVLDNDGPPGTPVLSVSDAVVDESIDTLQFFVTLSQPSTSAVTVSYKSVDDTALAGSDYTSVAGTLSFAPGEMVKTVNVPIRNDTLAEPDERFSLTLGQATGATIAQGTGTAMIGRSDGAPAGLPVLTAHATPVAEGDAQAGFVVQLSAPSEHTVTVTCQFDPVSTSYAMDDFFTLGNSLTFAPGETTKLVQVPLVNDKVPEPTEVFWLFMHSSVNATVAQAKVPALILDDDAPRGTPSLRIDDRAVNESDGSVTLAVMLDRPSASTVTVDYATADDTARAGSDYVATSGRLSFAPGEMVKTVTVKVQDDSLAESDETFQLRLIHAVNGTIGDAVGSVLISRNDTAPVSSPAVSITPLTVSEGDTFATVLVQLSAPARDEVKMSVPFAPGPEWTWGVPPGFYPLIDQLVFSPGETIKSVSLVLAGDGTVEGKETVLTNITNLVNATAPATDTVITIIDDDGAGRVYSYGRSNDLYTVTSALDRIAESPNGGIDTVRSSVSLALPDNVENLVLTGSALNGLGNAGNNTFTGTAANNSFDGKEGIDTVVFTGARAAYTLAGSTAQRTVSGGNDGSDTLYSIERLQFADAVLASDTTPGGNTYLACALLNAALNAAPPTAMLSQWTAQLDRLGTLTDTAQALLNTYAPGLPDEVLVAYLWNSLTGTQIPPDALATYTALVGSGTYTQAGLLALASTLDLNTVEITGIVGQTLTLDPAWFPVPG